MNTDSIEEATEKYGQSEYSENIHLGTAIRNGFKAGAEWQKEQDEAKIKQLQSDYMAVQNELNVAQMKIPDNDAVEFAEWYTSMIANENNGNQTFKNYSTVDMAKFWDKNIKRNVAQMKREDGDAVAFKDWCDSGKAWFFDNQEEHTHTTKELYKIFKEQK